MPWMQMPANCSLGEGGRNASGVQMQKSPKIIVSMSHQNKAINETIQSGEISFRPHTINHPSVFAKPIPSSIEGRKEGYRRVVPYRVV